MRMPVSSAEIERLAAQTQGTALEEIDVLTDAQVHPLANFLIGGDARLLGWLARHNLARGRPRVVLPEHESLSVASGAMTSQLSFYILSRMSAGVAHRGTDHSSELLRAQSRALMASNFRLQTSTTRAYFYDHQMPGLPMIPALDPPETEPHSRQVGRLLREDLQEMGLLNRSVSIGGPDPSLIRPIRSFVAETLENARKHAVRDLDNERIKGLAFLAIRRYLYRDHAERLAADGGAPLERYFEGLREKFGADLEQTTFVEFTVADSGLGIPAHFGSRLDVYVNDFSDEVRMLSRAFRMSEENRSWDGIGLSKVQEATRALHGFMSVRTGRLQASKQFISDPARELLELDVEQRAHALLGSTAISLLVPWRRSDDELPFGDS